MSSSPRASPFRGVQRWLKPLTNIRKRLMRFYKQPSRPIDAAQIRLQEGLSTLPVELLELIFQLAASDSYETALNLFRVSSAVKKWTAPMLYHTVHLRTARHAQLFQRTTDHLIPSNPSFLANNVRYIVFDYCIDDIQDVYNILRACTGIIGLAHGDAIEAPGFFINGLAGLTAPCSRLTRLFLHVPQIFPRTRLTLPCTLTHLSLNIDYRTLDVQSFWLPVRNKFPPLTHIMVGMELPLYSDDPVDVLVTLLRSWALDLPSSFQVILVRLISSEGLAMAPPSAIPDSGYLIASELRDLPKVAILYSKTRVFELYDPLTLDTPTMVYNGDSSASWLNNEIWEVAESLLLTRRFMV